ncbi:MAG: cation:proton antiporter [Planctomycetaceae bacterium]|nr:cation:proton antiporter [Planctomycetaceae bacterium]
MDLWTILRDIVVLLGASLLVGGLFARFRQSPIVGYLLAGMLLGGPGSLHAVDSAREIEAISELGVALLLFSLGLEFSISRLKRLGAKPLIGGVSQVCATIAAGLIGATLCGLPLREAIAIGAMVSLSSTAVVLRILMERSEMEMPHGNNSLGVLLTQDMAVVPLALLMTVLGGDGQRGEIVWNIFRLVAMAGGLVAAFVVLNRIAVSALGTLTLHRNRELTVIFAVFTGLGAAWASHAVGVSPALGAFVAGMLLGSSPFATQIRADVAPLQVVLLTLFFGAAGMVADPIWIITNLHLVAAVVAMILLGKLVIIWGIFVALGQSVRIAVATGVCLAQIGEFAFVLGSIGRAGSVVTEATYALIVSSAIVSFFLSAILVPRAVRIGDWAARLFGRGVSQAETDESRQCPPDVVIIGFGPAGQIVAGNLMDRNLQVMVLDLNHASIGKAQQWGLRAEVGDATQHEVLENAQVAKSRVVVITIPHHKSALAVLNHIRSHAPHIHTVVRVRYEAFRDDFVIAGADVITGDEQQAGESLSEHLNAWLKLTFGESNSREETHL